MYKVISKNNLTLNECSSLDEAMAFAKGVVGTSPLPRVRDSMGLGDVMPSMWSECEAEDGMHFNAQRYVAVDAERPEQLAALGAAVRQLTAPAAAQRWGLAPAAVAGAAHALLDRRHCLACVHASDRPPAPVR